MCLPIYLFIYRVMYVRMRSFNVKIVKLGRYILWPCKAGEFEDGTY